ncbi:MAG TPA: PadR family transcriptional regulator [Candidatus Eremiobacteraceae bacterium]|nr:PadR family transcriptional regulator [Candidatus Eremiobacteraceae bacterium]
MHKELLILGFVGDSGPISGYDIHRIVRAHGELFADLKRPNMYYLLERLAGEKYLRVRAEAGTRGRRGERLLYALTAAGKRRFRELLDSEVTRFGTVHTGIEVAVIFLAQLTPAAGIALLQKRLQIVELHRKRVAAAFGDVGKRGPHARIAADHMLTLVDAEIGWIKRSIATLQSESASAGSRR